jgi:hypothetical protein
LFVPTKESVRRKFFQLFSFWKLGCIILLAGHAGKAWSDLVSKNSTILLIAHGFLGRSRLKILEYRK